MPASACHGALLSRAAQALLCLKGGTWRALIGVGVCCAGLLSVASCAASASAAWSSTSCHLADSLV